MHHKNSHNKLNNFKGLQFNYLKHYKYIKYMYKCNYIHFFTLDDNNLQENYLKYLNIFYSKMDCILGFQLVLCIKF